MRNPSQGHVIGIPVDSVPETTRPCPDPSSCDSCQSKQNKADSVFNWMNKFGRNAQGIREHVRLGPKISETVKGKLSLGARILQAGGVERVFKQLFSVGEGEKLLKASQCYLSTSAGPIAGLLFISTHKIAFHSDRHLAVTSPNGEVVRTPYKVVIPLGKIKRANPSENMNKPRQKYIQIVTVDDFEFWFMGFVSYQRSFKYLQMAMIQSPLNFSQRSDRSSEKSYQIIVYKSMYMRQRK